MDLLFITKVLFILGALSGIILLKTKNIGKLTTVVFSSVASLCGMIFGVRILISAAGSDPNVDALSAFFVILITLLSFAASIYSYGYLEEYRGRKNLSVLGALLNIFVLAMVFVVTAKDMYVFLMAWETMSVASFFLVMTDYEKENVRKAGFIYVVMTHIGTAFIIFAFLLLAKLTGGNDFAHFAMANQIVSSQLKTVLFVLFLIGFSTKAGIVPLHIWLPRAHPVAPSHVSALMSGVMIKMAVYGLIRVVFSFLGTQNQFWGETIIVYGAVSAFLGIMYALLEKDIKRLLAYSSVENIGIIYISLGLSIVLASYNQNTLAGWALIATLVHTLNHAVFKGLLFMGAGAINKSSHTKNMELLGGLLKLMPWTGAFFLVGALAISALPPLNGFMGEWLIYQGLISAGIILPVVWAKMLVIIAAAVLALTGALSSYCFVKAFGMTFLAQPRSEGAKKSQEAEPSMLIAMGMLATFCILLGIFSPWLVQLLKPLAELSQNTQLDLVAGHFVGIYGGSKFTELNPLALFAVLTIGGLLLFNIFRSVARYKTIRRTETWTCGITPTARMEYTPTSFSQPLRIVFSAILYPEKLLTQEGKTVYFPEKMQYTTSEKAIYEDYFYRPLNRFIIKVSSKLRVFQSGQIQLYIIYIFGALIFLLLWAL